MITEEFGPKKGNKAEKQLNNKNLLNKIYKF